MKEISKRLRPSISDSYHWQPIKAINPMDAINKTVNKPLMPITTNVFQRRDFRSCYRETKLVIFFNSSCAFKRITYQICSVLIYPNQVLFNQKIEWWIKCAPKKLLVGFYWKSEQTLQKNDLGSAGFYKSICTDISKNGRGQKLCSNILLHSRLVK